ncbi:MAG TPA: PD-(D/E)XK nuclease family protein [Erysipelothrix sp.]
MTNNLFVSLSQYAPRENTTPTENFITEAFAWLLRNDSEVFQALIKLLQSKLAEDEVLESFELTDDMQISTQENFGGKFPDMVIQNSTASLKSTLVFEHKVWSNLHHNQLHNYRHHMEQERKDTNYRLILITALTAQHAQNPDIALCWQDIATCIQSLKSDSEKTSWIRDEFVKLLEANNLVSITDINPLSIKYYAAVKNIDAQLTTICERSFQLAPQPLIDQRHFTKSAKSRTRWGRIGYEVYLATGKEDQRWVPGIFTGFVIDSWDHALADIMQDKKANQYIDESFKNRFFDQPIICLMFSIERYLHPIQQFPAYKALVTELNEKLLDHPIWKVSDRTTINKHNPWHPLVIYCDLYDFYKNTTNFDSQLNLFQSEMEKLQNTLMKCPSFELLCKTLQNK